MKLHWLPIQAHIQFKLCVLMYQSLNGTGPTYIADMLQPAAELQRRTIIRSATNKCLVVPLFLVVGCALANMFFTVPAPLLWNSLPADVIHARRHYRKKL